MGEKSGFAFDMKRFMQKYWREMTIAFLLTVLVIALVAYLRGRNQRKGEYGGVQT